VSPDKYATLLLSQI